MTDAARDKERQPHGAMWYFALALFAHLTAFAPAIALLESMAERGVISHQTAELVSLVYLPFFWVIHMLGFDSEFSAVTDAIRQFLP